METVSGEPVTTCNGLQDSCKQNLQGNGAKMREALEAVRNAIASGLIGAVGNYPDKNRRCTVADITDKIEAALAAPPRNCDIGTAKEQGERAMEAFSEWRNRFSGMSLINAVMAWSQMPYKKGDMK